MKRVPCQGKPPADPDNKTLFDLSLIVYFGHAPSLWMPDITLLSIAICQHETYNGGNSFCDVDYQVLIIISRYATYPLDNRMVRWIYRRTMHDTDNNTYTNFMMHIIHKKKLTTSQWIISFWQNVANCNNWRHIRLSNACGLPGWVIQHLRDPHVKGANGILSAIYALIPTNRKETIFAYTEYHRNL